MRDAFFGRASELAALVGMLERGERVVTIVGPAGVGKTRLAHEVARRWSAGSGSAVITALEEAGDAGGFAAALATALGAAPTLPDPGSDPLSAAAQCLAARGPVVVVLDGFDQLVPWALVTVHRWRDVAPTAQLVVTARARLGIGDEVVFALGPLAGSGALAFLVERARQQHPELVPGPEDLALLGRIAVALEGLPWALSLAAAQLGALDPTALEARLSAALTASATRGDGAERARAATLECALSLASPHERDVLARCAVLRGAFTATTAEAVVGPVPAGLPPLAGTLGALVERRLARGEPTAPGSFRIEPAVRARALEELPRGDARAVRDLALAHFAARAAAWRAARRRGDPGWAVEVAPAQEDLLAALGHGLAEDATPAAARQAAALGAMLDLLSPLRLSAEQRLALLDRALHAAQTHDDGGAPGAALVASVLTTRGRARRRAGRHAEAAQDLERAEPLVPEGSDDALRGELLHELGRLRIVQARLASAEDLLVRALALHRRAGDRRAEVRTLSALGFARLQGGDAEGAQAPAAEALEVARALGDAHAVAACHESAALLVLHQGALGEAAGAFAQAEQAAEAAGDPWRAVLCRLGAGLALLEDGRAGEARAAFERAEPRVAGFDARAEGLLLAFLGSARALLGDLVDAGWLFDRAERLLQATDVALLPAVVGPARGLLDLARARRARSAGDEEGARAEARRAEQRLATARAAGPPDTETSRGASFVDTSRVVVCRLLEAALTPHRG